MSNFSLAIHCILYPLAGSYIPILALALLLLSIISLTRGNDDALIKIKLLVHRSIHPPGTKSSHGSWRNAVNRIAVSCCIESSVGGWTWCSLIIMKGRKLAMSDHWWMTNRKARKDKQVRCRIQVVIVNHSTRERSENEFQISVNWGTRLSVVDKHNREFCSLAYLAEISCQSVSLPSRASVLCDPMILSLGRRESSKVSGWLKIWEGRWPPLLVGIRSPPQWTLGVYVHRVDQYPLQSLILL